MTELSSKQMMQSSDSLKTQSGLIAANEELRTVSLHNAELASDRPKIQSMPKQNIIIAANEDSNAASLH